MPDQQITDEGGDLRRWRTELPNIIDDLGLDVFERALYGHYKRVCGANGGTCYESTRTTANKIPGMSAGQVSIVRRRLAEKGLITEETKHTIHINIIDIWKLNFAYYSVKKTPDIIGWTIPQLTEWVNENVYHINTPKEKRLPDKQNVKGVNDQGEKCLPHKTKKEPSSKNQPVEEKDSPPTPADFGIGATPPLDGVPVATDGHQRAVDAASGGSEVHPIEEIVKHLRWMCISRDAPMPKGSELRGYRRAARILLEEKINTTDWQGVCFAIDDWHEHPPEVDIWQRDRTRDPFKALNCIATHYWQLKNGGQRAKNRGRDRRGATVPDGYTVADPADFSDSERIKAEIHAGREPDGLP